MKNIYHQRRQALIELIQQTIPNFGAVVLFANFEQDGSPFVQESNFYYLSGIQEPGSILVFDQNNRAELYIPNTAGIRSKWVADAATLASATDLEVSNVKYLGDQIAGYVAQSFIAEASYVHFLNDLKKILNTNRSILTIRTRKLEQQFIIQQLASFAPNLSDKLVDVSDQVASLRRKKSDSEIDYICQAIDITAMAHEAASKSVQDGVLECEVQASIEYIFTAAGSSPAFPSIVGGGKNSTVLHYFQNSATLQNGDVVVIDIGAKYQGYCADITRTYPVGGKFTARQLEIYELVLAAQTYIAELAVPGMWLSNKAHPDKSLLHLAQAFLRENGGYDQFFWHGIGHYLGIDVHDVGSYVTPLQENDVITIEPGIYLPDEKLGVRIEDN